MSKIKFLTSCPGCKDEHLGVQCKKPSYVTPVITKSVCDECESTTILKVSLPKGRTEKNTIQVSPMKITISPKLAQTLMRKELEKVANQETPTEQSNG